MKSLFNELEYQLCGVLNESPLPIDAKYYIVRNFFLNVEKAHQDYLRIPDEDFNNEGEVEIEHKEEE